jgi:hypothetical protein
MEVSYSILRDTPPAPGPVNIVELRIVREHHMPTMLVQFSPLCEVLRRAKEVSQQHPHLSEEAQFVLADEVTRRMRLAQSPVQLAQ